ncbi:ion transporter [Calycomorphotria hydatis]|uniref:Cyclic nucleotide-gated potassium channel n=1 Tax=Calycomorphotria hydatis TaxID=2528027 RepID=A0A517TEV0_9PLAN|nr:ion transporter [Calycomorphotria hydatis]QDT66897.1 Cyclic nucleotide-gated potassium channel [Calycomorphotria hydatis]
MQQPGSTPQQSSLPDQEEQSFREHLFEVIFEADTPAGKWFDVALLIVIMLSILVMMLESVHEIDIHIGEWLWYSEIFFTLLFTAEYLVRIYCAPKRWRYMCSFFGVIDLLAILPTYLVLALPSEDGFHRLGVIRGIRLLRAFRIFKLAHMLSEATALREAIWSSRSKIAVFLAFIVISVVIVGSAMHVIEGPEHGFTSIPLSMYWAIVTMTTVGYGDIAPETPLGKMIAAAMMLLGYCMIIVPTGIITAELSHPHAPILGPSTQVCPECLSEEHDSDARYCKHCGTQL